MQVFALVKNPDGTTERIEFESTKTANQWAAQQFRQIKAPLKIEVYRMRYLRSETSPTQEPISIWKKD